MTHKVITVKRIFENPSKKDPTQKWWNVVDEEGTKYAIFKTELAPWTTGLLEGKSGTIDYTTNDAGYHAIQSVVMTDNLEVSPFEDEYIPQRKTELPAVTSLVNERIAAMAAASLLVAHDRQPLADITKLADRILAYYHAIPAATTTPVKPAAQALDPDDFLRRD